jgi:hypothetical protein
MIEIKNPELLLNSLHTLTETSVASFGKMSAKHMIEHLILTVKISSNKLPHPCSFREEKANAFKQALIYSPAEMPQGFRSPLLTDGLPPLIHTDIQSALTELAQELNYFDAFFKTNPNIKTTNPSLGDLSHDEWVVFHNKHFTHHFKQFNLV